MRITETQLFDVQQRIGKIKGFAEDRPQIKDECDAISKILQDVIKDAVQR